MDIQTILVSSITAFVTTLIVEAIRHRGELVRGRDIRKDIRLKQIDSLDQFLAVVKEAYGRTSYAVRWFREYPNIELLPNELWDDLLDQLGFLESEKKQFHLDENKNDFLRKVRDSKDLASAVKLRNDLLDLLNRKSIYLEEGILAEIESFHKLNSDLLRNYQSYLEDRQITDRTKIDEDYNELGQILTQIERLSREWVRKS